MSVGGVALAILLILVLDGVFAGAMKQLTFYMDKTPYDITLAQEGVGNLHMTSSFFPASKAGAVKKVRGVKGVDSIFYNSDYLVIGENRSLAYVIGYQPGKLGGPWEMAEGSADLKPGEIIVDERIADKYDLKIGDRLTVLGRSFKVGGLAKGTVNITNSIAFVRYDDFERARGLRGVVSYSLVTVKRGENPRDVIGRIKDEVKGINVMTREEFADNEKRLVSDMAGDVIKMMNLVGFLIGLAVLGLTAYTATLSKVREYGILKAIGAKNRKLIGVVFKQAIISVVGGFVIAVALAFAVAFGLGAAQAGVSLVIGPPSLLKVILGAGLITILASSIPILRIAGLNPAEVFRR